MIGGILRSLIADQVERGIKDALAPLAPYLRKLGLGLALIALGTLCFGLVLLTLSIALFMAIAELPYLAATLWVALTLGALGILLTSLGFRSLRRPR